MKCAVLCGGLATRLGDRASAVPKVMMSVGDKPLLDHLFGAAREAGVREVLLLTGHLSEVVERYVQDGSRWGLVAQVQRETEPLGTAGAVKSAADRLAGDDFLLLYGDVMLSMDLARMADFHRRARALATLAVHPNDHPHDSDLVETDAAGRIMVFHSKPHAADRYYDNLVNAGAYVLSPAVLQQVPAGVKLDFGRDVFPRLVDTRRLYGYATAEYLHDVGTPQRLEEVNRDWRSERIRLSHRAIARPAVFLDRDGVINVDVGGVRSDEQLELLPGVAEAIRRINAAGWLAIVVTNQPVLAKGWTTADQLRKIHRKMSTLLGRAGAYLDAVYHCPHHPERGFPGEVAELKISCSCRKPGTGLIERAMAEFNVDRSRSVLVGDAPSDFACARAAGLLSLGVHTGRGWAAGESPDWEFANLPAAVDKVLDPPRTEMNSYDAAGFSDEQR